MKYTDEDGEWFPEPMIDLLIVLGGLILVVSTTIATIYLW